MSAAIRIGTRGSALALAQTGLVADALERAGARVEIITVSTPGDRSSAPIAEIGIGVFTSALRDALADGTVDVAVHSYKDLPTAPDPRVSLAAVPPRADPRDALVARDGLTLGELLPGSRVGTGSPRRAAQLEALGFGLSIVPIRGNVDTRIRKVSDGELDAVVLAKAGLDRIGRTDAITEVLEPIQMLPAPAQGALAVECRVEDMDVEHLLRSTVDDSATRAAVAAERSMLAALEAGCSAPVGALAEVVEDLESGDDGDRVVYRLSLRGVAAVLVRTSGDRGRAGGPPEEPVSPTPDSRQASQGVGPSPPVGFSTVGRTVDLLRASATGELAAAEQLGRALAAELLELGAGVLSGPES